MFFCPRCANALLVEHSAAGGFRFYCQTCPYVCAVANRITNTVKFERKRVDDVLGGESAWEGAAQTTVICPECNHDKSYFFTLQIRSADEPSTKFFRCVNCKHRFNED